ncbi:MAG TPA: flavodoxin-dependent (E)-4-hydroxy-3-methylbut-2-enyl-diphosphate synthase [Candidatus Ozemobacteraceae bacterium]|nr:flavodoxin-dependent (E)-4-hydroxy-3-methylbut-2-enyl-diphosphate synthase [Candidatus Ozemobacteraceae bacterium]
MARRTSKMIRLGAVRVGGGAPVTVQTMTKTDTRDAEATLREIERLALAGCEIIRLAVPDMAAADALGRIAPRAPIPVIADIHFDHLLALRALEGGVHGLRLNPGNLRDADKVRQVARAASERGVPIRVGVNAGSLDPAIAARHGGVTPAALAESALKEVALLESAGFGAIKIAVKAFDLHTMIEAARIVARSCEHPLHLGVTESGLPEEGIIRSAMGIGTLLLEGIGDTIRVSLTGDSAEEIAAGIRILRCAGLREAGPTIVSCPTCGRCQIPLQSIARDVSRRVAGLKAPITIAVMGCAVNGPGEARQADFGIAGGRESGLVFRNGQIVKTLPAAELVDGLLEEINRSLTGNGEKK